MKLTFKTVKEFLEFLTGEDYEFAGGNIWVCYEVDTNAITVSLYTCGDYDDADYIDTIYGYFFENGGHLELCSDNNWAIDFRITDETLKVGSIYKLKVPEITLEEKPKFIEL